MKGIKVIIAAVAVAFMFLLVPFSSVASDADWGAKTEKAVYFESDSDKITWDNYKYVTGTTEETYAGLILTVLGYELSLNTYDFSGFSYENIVMKGGKGGVFVDKENKWEITTITSFDFKFTITAKTVGSTLFTDGLSQQVTDLTSYLGLEDGKLKVGDKLEFSGTFSGESANKSVKSYKDLDETNAALYYNELDVTNNMNVTSSEKFIRGDVTKDFEQTGSYNSSRIDIESYEMDDDEKVVSKEKLYVKTVTKTEGTVGSCNITYDKKELAPTPTATLVSDNSVTYAKGSAMSSEIISDIGVDTANITYKSWLNITAPSPTETELKNKLETMGKLSEDYSDVDAVCESILNPPEPEETPVNQWLFFGAFIVILAIAVVVAVVLREKNKE